MKTNLKASPNGNGPKFFAVLAAALMIFAGAATVLCESNMVRADEIVGDFTYSTSGDEATVTGLSTEGLTKQSIEIPAVVEIDGITYNVVAIADNAFFGKGGLFTSVTMNEGLKTIGASAFQGMMIAGTVKIPDTVTDIGNMAFMMCTNLTGIVIGKGVTNIGDTAFVLCTNVSSVKYNATNATLGNNVFMGIGTASTGITVTFGDSVQSIPAEIFKNNDKLKSVSIGNNVTSFGNLAFGNCPNIKNVIFGTIPSTATVGDNVFSYGTETTDDYVFSNMVTGKEITFTQDNARAGLFSDRIYGEGTTAGTLAMSYALVTFNKNDGSGAWKTIMTDSNGKLKEPFPGTPTREGFFFKGWYDGDTPVTKDTVFLKNTNVDAKWIAKHTITFNANGGTCDVETMTTDINEKIAGALPTPTREGYAFDGWYLNGEKVTQDTVFTSDATVTAQWTAVLEPQKDTGGDPNIALLFILVLVALGTLYFASRRN